MLALNIIAEDGRRIAEGAERLDDDLLDEIGNWEDLLLAAPDSYQPTSFWDDLPRYIEVAVEKGRSERPVRPSVPTISPPNPECRWMGGSERRIWHANPMLPVLGTGGRSSLAIVGITISL